ncbi:MAG: helix-turn-helix domain-containing protein [Umezawaea sp.]
MTTRGRALRRRLVAALSTDAEPFGERILTRLRAEIPVYGRRGEDDLLPAILTSRAWILEPLEEGRAFTDAELAAFSSYGEVRARQGIPAEDMLRAWRLSIREFFDDMVEAGRLLRMTDGALLELTRDLLATTDAAILAFSQGHHRAEVELARQEEHRRTDFVRGVLLAGLGAAGIRQQALRHGLDPDREYYAVRARPAAETPMAVVERLLGFQAHGGRARGMVALIEGDVAGFVDRKPADGASVVVGVGAPARLELLAPSFHRATRALATATAFGLTGVHDLGGLGLLPAVLADADVSDELARRYLRPLGDGEAAKPILDTVRRYLSSGWRADVTAREMSVHHNTVRYRVRRYEELADVDLRDPDRALEVWWALQHARLGDRPERR